jgi:hypothetical protein
MVPAVLRTESRYSERNLYLLKGPDTPALLALRGVRLSNYAAVRDIVVSIATRYEMDGPGIESWWGARFSAPVQTGPRAHPASYTMGTESFPGVKRKGRGVDHPRHQAPRLKKEQNYTSNPLLGLRGLL